MNPIAGFAPGYVWALTKFWVTAWRPFITGAERLVPPTWPLCGFVPAALRVETKRTPVLGSPTATTSGIPRPGHGALASTPGPFCHDGRANTLEHQLPEPLQVVEVL